MAYPADNQFIPFGLGGVAFGDVPNDASPGSVDIVGNETFPAAFLAYDGTTLHFRMRVNEDPRNSQKTGFQNFAWGYLINTSGVAGTYQWMLSVLGLRNRIALIQNTVFEVIRSAATGQPIPNAVVYVQYNQPPAGIAATVQTDSLGRYVVPNLVPGNSLVVASAPGYAAEAATVVAEAGTMKTLDFFLPTAADIRISPSNSLLAVWLLRDIGMKKNSTINLYCGGLLLFVYNGCRKRQAFFCYGMR